MAGPGVAGSIKGLGTGTTCTAGHTWAGRKWGAGHKGVPRRQGVLCKLSICLRPWTKLGIGERGWQDPRSGGFRGTHRAATAAAAEAPEGSPDKSCRGPEGGARARPPGSASRQRASERATWCRGTRAAVAPGPAGRSRASWAATPTPNSCQVAPAAAPRRPLAPKRRPGNRGSSATPGGPPAEQRQRGPRAAARLGPRTLARRDARFLARVPGTDACSPRLGLRELSEGEFLSQVQVPKLWKFSWMAT